MNEANENAELPQSENEDENERDNASNTLMGTTTNSEIAAVAAINDDYHVAGADSSLGWFCRRVARRQAGAILKPKHVHCKRRSASPAVA